MAVRYGNDTGFDEYDLNHDGIIDGGLFTHYTSLTIRSTADEFRAVKAADIDFQVSSLLGASHCWLLLTIGSGIRVGSRHGQRRKAHQGSMDCEASIILLKGLSVISHGSTSYF